MNNLNKLIKSCLVCTTLWLVIPSPALGQYYETTYEEQYCPPHSESSQRENKSEEESGGLPWWAWVIIGWIVLGWIFGSDNDSESSSSLSSSHHGGGYVIDPSR